MIDESKVADAGALSPRAGVALLTLQLRSTLQEAIDAEAEVDAVDVDSALWQLRSRLGPLMEDRRQALAADLAAEREHADAAVTAARAEAAQIVLAARNRADAAVERAARAETAQRAALALAQRQVALAAESPVTEPPVTAKPDLFDDPLLDWHPKLAPATLPPPSEPQFMALPTIIEASSVVPAEAIVESPAAPIVDAPSALLAAPTAASLFASASEAPAGEPPSSTLWLPAVVTDAPAGASDQRAMHVVIDADSFAKAFAAALAPVLDARSQAPVYPPQAYMPVPAPASKKSFWAHAWHPDVLLSGLAMVIVIIVLIAWTG